MTEKEIMEALHSVRNAIGDAEDHATTANEYAEEAESAANNAASSAEEAGNYAETAKDELNELIAHLEGEDITFFCQREVIVAEVRNEVVREVQGEVILEVTKLFSKLLTDEEE